MLKEGGEEKMVKVICHKSDCGYTWETDSEMMFVTCPSCRSKTLRIKKEEVPVVENE